MKIFKKIKQFRNLPNYIKTKKIVANFYKNLKNIIIKYKIRLFIIFFAIFFLCGNIFNFIWNFPYFYYFIILFHIIGFGAYWSEKIFIKKINNILADTSYQPPFQKAHVNFLLKNKHFINYLIPIVIVLVFGVGGCILYRNIQITPTLIWVLLVFSGVVYISIKGYLQYIYLLLFVLEVAISKEKYINLPEIMSAELPREINWKKRLNNLCWFYQSVFFTLGSFYIIAFALFCFTPEFGVISYKVIFHILWLIIFIAIVLIFPIVSSLEIFYNKKIERNLKSSYREYWKKIKLPYETNEPLSKVIGEMIRDRCLSFVFPKDSKGLVHYFKLSYVIGTAVFNLVVSIITILQFYGITINDII